MEQTPRSIEQARYDAAIRAREFEIDLFWKRALFFWGFLAAAFVALAATHQKSPRLAVVVASFGMVCSWTWSLANRGSKYWYESWEQKVQTAERSITGPLFAQIETPKDDAWPLSGRRYSVSRLAIGFSYFTWIVWTVILVYEVIELWCKCVPNWIANASATSFAVFSMGYGLWLWRKCRVHKDVIRP